MPKKKSKHNLIKRCEERNLIKLVNATLVNEAEDEINVLHNECGFMVFASKDEHWHQWSYKKENINNVFIQNLLGINKDTYISMNSFKSPRRLISNLFGLNALWSDLDYYKTEYKDKSYEEMIEILSRNELIKKAPPSFYLYSGNGMYVIWLLESANAKACLPIWNKLMSVIHNEMKPYGADAAACDPARVLRLAGTRNLKTNNVAKIVKDSYIFSPKRYSIKSISELILPKLKFSKEELVILKNKKKKNKKEKEACKVQSLFNIYTLNYARMQDLQKIVELRDGNCEGFREQILFLYRYWGNCFWKDSEKALEETLEFNKMFSTPLDQKEVIKATKRAEIASAIWDKKLEDYWKLEKKPSVSSYFKNTGCYIYSNEKLIKLLQITQEEMASPLITIINTKEKNRRNKDYRNEWNKAQRRNENGLQSREQAKMDKIYAILDLLEKGYKQKDIALELGYGKSTVSEYVKEIKVNNIVKPNNINNSVVDIEFTRVTDNELKLLVI